MVHDLAERPDLEVPVGALDAQELALLLGALDEFAHVRVRPLIGVVALRLGGIEHGLVPGGAMRGRDLNPDGTGFRGRRAHETPKVSAPAAAGWMPARSSGR